MSPLIFVPVFCPLWLSNTLLRKKYHDTVLSMHNPIHCPAKDVKVLATGDDDNDVNGATVNKVDDDGDGATGNDNDANDDGDDNDDGDGDGAMGSGATGYDDEDEGDGRQRHRRRWRRRDGQQRQR